MESEGDAVDELQITVIDEWTALFSQDPSGTGEVVLKMIFVFKPMHG